MVLQYNDGHSIELIVRGRFRVSSSCCRISDDEEHEAWPWRGSRRQAAATMSSSGVGVGLEVRVADKIWWAAAALSSRAEASIREVAGNICSPSCGAHVRRIPLCACGRGFPGDSLNVPADTTLGLYAQPLCYRVDIYSTRSHPTLLPVGTDATTRQSFFCTGSNGGTYWNGISSHLS
jgi:hypothetical protein